MLADLKRRKVDLELGWPLQLLNSHRAQTRCWPDAANRDSWTYPELDAEPGYFDEIERAEPRWCWQR